MGQDSIVNVVTRYGLDAPGIEYRVGRVGEFPQPSRPALRPTQPPVQWVPGHFPGGKAAGRGIGRPPISSVKVKEPVQLNSTLPLGLHGMLQGEFLLQMSDHTSIT